jgi:hypothetical protein
MSISLQAQDQFTVSGRVTDASSGETLIGATILSPSTQQGTTTNEYGFYSLSLPANDSATLIFSYVGFQNSERTLLLTEDLTINVELGEGIELEEVVIKANSFKEQLNSTQMSVERLDMAEVKLLPALLGEVDILKTLQLKPGIPSGAEGRTGLFVRGGAGDQNLIVLDEAIVYNPNHLFGFFSTFNADAVKDLQLYKGGFPPQYGGRLSSVIDVKLKDGNNKKFAGAGGIGLISSRLTLEGPIQEGKSSFIVSGRRTYVDIFTRAVNRANEDNEDFSQIPDYFFYDLNTKVNYQINDKNKFFLSGYFGRDVFGFTSDFFSFNFNWGNATGTARWNHTFSPKLFSNATFTFSDYQYNITNEITGFSFEVGSKIRDANLKYDFYYNLSDQHNIKFGVQATNHEFEVGRLQAGSDDGEVSFSAGQNFDGVEFGAYIQDDFIVNSDFTVSGGFRLSGFNNEGKTYIGWEPRIASKYSLTDRLSLKASYARMYQYVHLISNASVALPTDIWYPSTANVAPQISDQIATGFSFALGDQYFITNEYYYKWLDNQIDFIDGAQLFANDNLEEEFAFGDGFAYGGELSIEKREGRLQGWIGYTLAWIRRGNFRGVKQDIMDGRYFAPRYDRRHDVSVVATYDLSRRLKASATWVYGSGDLTWLPQGRIALQDVPGAEIQPVIPVFGDRNTFRLPAYHRLDLGLVIKFFPKWGESDLTVSVYNAYDRRNPYFIFLEPEFDVIDTGPDLLNVPSRVAAKQQSLFPILPSVTWNFKF